MTFRTGTSGSSRARSRGRQSKERGFTTVINRHRVQAVVSERQGPDDEESAAVIEVRFYKETRDVSALDLACQQN